MFSLHVNKENSYKLKQEVFLDQCCLHLVKWSIFNAQMLLFSGHFGQKTVTVVRKKPPVCFPSVKLL